MALTVVRPFLNTVQSEPERSANFLVRIPSLVQKDCHEEPPLVTAGKELADIARFIPVGQNSYSAEDVLRVLLAGCR